MLPDREHKSAMDTGAVQPFAENLSLTSQRHLSTRVLGSRQVVNNSHLCVCECVAEFVYFISVNGKVYVHIMCFVCCTAACSLNVSVTYVSMYVSGLYLCICMNVQYAHIMVEGFPQFKLLHSRNMSNQSEIPHHKLSLNLTVDN